MKIQKKILVSIIIANYNNSKFLLNSLNSCLNQSYNNKEIIVFDDNSTDNSLEILKKFNKKITKIKNKNQKSHGSYNQINAYYKSFLKSKGDIIFFLDSDDFFSKKKVKEIVKEFSKNKNKKIIFDLPIYTFKNKKKKKKFKQKKYIISSWPRFSPQSCISVKRTYAKELFKMIRLNKFETIWLDFRIALCTFLKFNNIYILKKYLTFYRQIETSASKEYKFFSKKWWIRRDQAHSYYSYLSKKLKIKDRITLDKVITRLVGQLNK